LPVFALIVSCEQGSFEKGDPSLKVGEKDTLAIYWEPMEYDSILSFIGVQITFDGDDTLGFLPSDQDLYFKPRFSAELKEYMNHGRLVLKSCDSCYQIETINDTLFRLMPNMAVPREFISLEYSLTFDPPYYFSYLFDSSTRTVSPNDTALIFIRRREVKPCSL
jgi:hypothetical protein